MKNGIKQNNIMIEELNKTLEVIEFLNKHIKKEAILKKDQKKSE